MCKTFLLYILINCLRTDRIGKQNLCTALNTDLVIASLGNVTDPTICVVPRFVIDSQKADMHSTGRKHRYLEFHIDGRSAPRLGANCWHKVDFCTNLTFSFSSKPLDTPDNGLLLGFVLGSPERLLDLGLGGIFWDGNLYHDMRGIQLIREISNNLEVDGHPANTMR